MIPAGFEYLRARTLRDALKVLAAGNGAKAIAGGHSLIPLLRFRLAQPSALVDIGQLAELKGIEVKGRKVRIGAATTYRELLESEPIRARFPLIAEATATIGDLQVRNAGTIGGGLAHADPASDMPAVMLALGATFNLRSATGKRAVNASEFFLGPFTTAMKDDELLVDIVLPPAPAKAGMAYVSFEQQASGYPLAAAAAVITRSRRTVKAAVVAVTGLAGRAFLADVSGVVGTHADGATLDAATENLAAGREVNADIHASAEYRTHLARVAVKRAVATALGRAG